MNIQEEYKKALDFYMEMQICPWFNQHRTKECICKEFRKLENTLVLVNNECSQHGCPGVKENVEKN